MASPFLASVRQDLPLRGYKRHIYIGYAFTLTTWENVTR